jgi:hypothetical protein
MRSRHTVSLQTVQESGYSVGRIYIVGSSYTYGLVSSSSAYSHRVYRTIYGPIHNQLHAYRDIIIAIGSDRRVATIHLNPSLLPAVMAPMPTPATWLRLDAEMSVVDFSAVSIGERKHRTIGYITRGIGNLNESVNTHTAGEGI